MKPIAFFSLLCLFFAFQPINSNAQNSITTIKVVKDNDGEKSTQIITLTDASEEEINNKLEEMKEANPGKVVSIDIDKEVNNGNSKGRRIIINGNEIEGLENLEGLEALEGLENLEDLENLSFDLDFDELGDGLGQIFEQLGFAFEEMGDEFRNQNIIITENDRKSQPKLGVYSSVNEGINGVLITKIASKSAAANAKLQIGDIIKMIDGRTISDMSELKEVVGDYNEGDEALFSIARDGIIIESTVTFTPPYQKTNRSIFEDYNYTPSQKRLGITIDKKDDDLIIESIQSNSIATDLGLEKGDVIIKIDGENVETIREVKEQVQKMEDEVKVKVIRNGKTKVLIAKIK